MMENSCLRGTVDNGPDKIKSDCLDILYAYNFVGRQWMCVINTLKQPMFPVTRFLGLRDNADSL